MHRTALIALILLATAGCSTEYEGVDLFPLYRDVGDEKAGEFFWLLPPWYESWSPGERLSWSLPFHLHSESGPRTELTMVPLLPLYFHNREPDSELLSIFPIYQRSTTGARSDSKVLLLLAGWSKDAGDSDLKALSVTPLFDWSVEGTGIRRGYVTTSDFLTGRAGAGALFTLLDVDRTGLAFHGGDVADETSTVVDFVCVFGGLFRFFRTGDAGSFDEWRLVTLFDSEPLSLVRWRTPHEGAPGAQGGARTIFPLWFDLDDGTARMRMFWPFYGQSQRGDSVTDRWFVYPLVHTFADADEQRDGTDFLWRLAGSSDEHGESATWFHPLFRRRSTADSSSWDVLFGLVGWERKGDESSIETFWFHW